MIKATGVMLPAGEYWVGDPCYAVPDSRWMEWLEAANYLDNPDVLAAELDGLMVVGVGTTHGDGEYYGSDGEVYPVDAGLIGAVPVKLTAGEPDGMTRMTFTQEFECRRDKDGVIYIGHIEIPTDDAGEIW